MERQPSSEADLEGRLEAYFQHRAASLRAPAGLWQRVAARINAQVNEGEPRSVWARLRRLLSPPWQWRPLGAAASIATLTLATIAITLAVTSPWNPDVSTLESGREDAAMLPGQPGPRGEPGTSGLLAVDLSSNADGRWMATTVTDSPVPAARPARSALVLADPDDQRMTVYQSTLWLRVDDVDAALESLVEHTRRMGGYIVSSFRDGSDSARLTVRVPVETFDDARKTFSAIALEVEREETTNEDVTEQYVDLESRLRNWQAAESQYLELLQDARNVDEALQVQNRLFQVREDIERIQGQMQLLEHTSETAAITIFLNATEPILQQGWSPSGTGRSALRSLSDFGQRLAGVGIWLGIYSPVWALALAMLFVLVRRARRH